MAVKKKTPQKTGNRLSLWERIKPEQQELIKAAFVAGTGLFEICKLQQLDYASVAQFLYGLSPEAVSLREEREVYAKTVLSNTSDVRPLMGFISTVREELVRQALLIELDWAYYIRDQLRRATESGEKLDIAFARDMMQERTRETLRALQLTESSSVTDNADNDNGVLDVENVHAALELSGMDKEIREKILELNKGAADIVVRHNLVKNVEHGSPGNTSSSGTMGR